MKKLYALIQRNCKLFFKDKGMFFTSLITPLILLVLYVTFLGKIYRDSFASAMPEGFSLPEKLINGMVGGQLISSLLAVCCVTVAFCSNLLMVQDKVTGRGQGSYNDTGQTLRSGTRILYFKRACNADYLLDRFIRGAFLFERHRLVSVVCRCTASSFRHHYAGSVRNGIIFRYPLSFVYQRSGIGCRNDCQRRLWLYLRRLYADIEFPRRPAKGDLLSSGYLRNISPSESCFARRLRGDVGSGIS